jgi:tetratricopeptide (TPR) repeat protein
MAESPRLEELRRRVQGDPASIAFAALAEELRRASRFREAVEVSRAGLRHHPTYVSARVTLGRSLVELQEFEQAEREFAFVLRSAPDNLAARRALGELCWQRLRFADALTHFRAARTLAPDDKELPGIIGSLERELEAERAAAVEAGAGAAGAAAAAETITAELAGAHAGNGRAKASPVLVALERFYRAIVRARDARDGADQPPSHAASH